MRIISCILFFILSLSIGFQQALTIACFKLNQKRIEHSFCVNKEDVDRHCKGTCFLQKQLDGSEKPAPLQSQKKMDVFQIGLTAFKIKNTKDGEDKKAPPYKNRYYQEPCLDVLLPPPIG